MNIVGRFVLQLKMHFQSGNLWMIKKYDTLKPTVFLIFPKSLITFIYWAATFSETGSYTLEKKISFINQIPDWIVNWRLTNSPDQRRWYKSSSQKCLVRNYCLSIKNKFFLNYLPLYFNLVFVNIWIGTYVLGIGLDRFESTSDVVTRAAIVKTH